MTMTLFSQKPEPFLELIIHDNKRNPGLTGTCAGYECGEWRYDEFADYIFEWLPEFSLKYSELVNINSSTSIRLIKRAAKTVYNTDKYGKRGEFGELLLHALLREVFNSEPAVSKIYYKSSVNDTVKGFDAVHVVESNGELELWLGEVKFYNDIGQAIRDITTELKKHLDRDYLKEEFILVESKVDSKWKYADKFKSLISKRNSLDNIFARTCIPVLLTYESNVVSSFSKVSPDYKAKLISELEACYSSFTKNSMPKLRIHLFLVPLKNKQKLVDTLHLKLEGMQR